MENINRDLVEKRYHIVDNNDRNHSLQSAVQQSMKQQNYKRGNGSIPLTENLFDKDFQFKAENKGEVLNSLEEKLQRKVVVLDATSVLRGTELQKSFVAKYLNSGKVYRNSFQKVLERYKNKRKIILLWRGNRWQAVLPD